MAYSFPEYQDVLTFGRSTHDTVLDSDGQLKTILNRLNPSTDLSDSGAWTPTGMSQPVASGTGSKGKARYLLTADTSTGLHKVEDSISYTAGHYVCHAVDVEANGYDFSIILPSAAFGAAVQYDFDMTTFTATQVTGGTKDSASLVHLSGNEYRLFVYAEVTSTASGNVALALHNGTSTSFAGDGSSGAYASRVAFYKASVHAPVERVTNGTFDTDVSGWSAGDGASTLAFDTGRLKLNNGDATPAYATQTITCVVGETYRIFADVDNTGNGSNRARIIAGGVTTTSTSASTEALMHTFVASSTSEQVLLSNGTAGVLNEFAHFDNISVTKVITDGIQLGSDGEDFVDGAGPIYVDGRAYDGNGAALGKHCFEGRTNLAIYGVPSSTWWNATQNGTGVLPVVTDNAAVSPSGDLDATQVDLDRGAGGTSGDSSVFSHPSMSVSSGSEYTGMTWVKAATGSDVGKEVGFRHAGNSGYTVITLTDSWQKISTQETAAATTSIIEFASRGGGITADQTVSVLIWQCDLQLGSSEVPSIPTNGSAVARGADSTYKMLNEFGFRQDQYSVLAEFQSAGSDGADVPRVFEIGDGTTSNRSLFYVTSPGNLHQVVDDGAVRQVDASLGAYTANSAVKAALAYKQDNFAAADDGDAVVTDVSGSMPPASGLYLGHAPYASAALNGYLKRLVVWPTRLADATLVEQSS